MADLIEPKPVTVDDLNGVEKTYTISKLPATVGREVVATYPVSALPKLGEYSVNEAIMLKMMSYVKAPLADGGEIALTTKALIDNHCADWQVLAKLEMAMLEYNTSFFGHGKISAFLDDVTARVPKLITQILTDLSAQSSAKEKPPSTN